MMNAAQKPHHSENDSDINVSSHVAEKFRGAKVQSQPYRHWLMSDMLPGEMYRDLLELPISVPDIADTLGKRDTHNKFRTFFSPDVQAANPAVARLCAGFQSPETVKAIQSACNISLAGGYLRIEYCQDRDGFWLEPHMDIKEKFITIQIYLNTDSDAATLGTDLYDSDKRPVGTAPAELGQCMVFVPDEPNSYHGFEKRPIKSVRRSLIINYVTGDWRSRHELAFPEHPIS
jgi:hypothetical protein